VLTVVIRVVSFSAPFVYRLGQLVFDQLRPVRFWYGVLLIASGAAWCGRLLVTEFNQEGSMPFGAALTNITLGQPAHDVDGACRK
jgi:hypothetical protein